MIIMAIVLWLLLASLATNIVLVFVIYFKKPDGEIVISTDEEGKTLFSLELDKSPEEIEEMDLVSFKVVAK